MFDTMTLTKVTGAVCGSLLVYLFISWAGEGIYHGGGAESHDGEEVAQAYSIAVEDAAPAGGAVVEGPPWAEVYAAADASAGENVFRRCSACHKVDGGDGTGPHLNGIIGRARGSVEGFAYSEAMAADQTPWTTEHMELFIKNPRSYVPGTKMGFAGLADIKDRANVIAYLETIK
jgi:cytochrome c